MLRIVAIAAMLALAVPTLAAAQENNPQHHPGGAKAPPGKSGGPPGGAKPFVQQRGAPRAGVAGPRPGVPGPRPGFVGARVGGPGGARQFTYHGHPFNRVQLSPFVYPNGWAYRRWAIGAALPALFLAPAYYYADWATLGLDPPPPGFQWVRYGPDLLLVNVADGQIAETIYDAFE
jgi:hypothetical protein